MSATNQAEPEHRPFIPAEVSLQEITVKAVILGALLSVILASANVYLGLFAGITVSASIPAAVISMGVLRLFPKRNILENNIVQTATSAGESLAAGVIFTIPALVILGTWQDFSSNALDIILIAVFAGVLGVVFTVPLRRAFIVDAKLTYPEGVACAEVLETGEEGGAGVKIIALGGLVGAFSKFAATGWQLWQETADYAFRVRDALFPFGSNLSPALVGVGYIVGPNIATVVFLGGVISWLVAMPIYTSYVGFDETVAILDTLRGVGTTPGVAPLDTTTWEGLVGMAGALWSFKIRYMGVGAMAVGGLYALLRLAKPLASGIQNGVAAYRQMRRDGVDTRIRTDQDLPMVFLGALVLVALVPLGWIYFDFTESVPRALMLGIAMLVFGFLFSSVAGYMAGLVGSSNNPISGVTIASTLVAGGLLWMSGISDALGPVGTIAAAATIASAGAIAGDNMQDLKTGYILGATPKRQQVMQLVGVVAAALAIPFILQIIHSSYGICVPPATPDTGCLAAPQANLIGSVAGAFFGVELPWTLVLIGAMVAVLIILVDLGLETSGAMFRMPVLAVAVGIYLPLELTTAIFIGGMIHLLVLRTIRRKERLFPDRDERRARGLRWGILLASGLIAGEAIMGILLGIPRLPAFSPDGSNPLAIFAPTAFPFSGVLVLVFVGILLWYVGVRPFIGERNDRAP